MPFTSLPIASAWSGTPGDEKVYSTRHLRPTTQSKRFSITSGHGAPRFGSRITVARSSICMLGQKLPCNECPVAHRPLRALPPRETELPGLLRAQLRALARHLRLHGDMHALRLERGLDDVLRLLADRDEPLLVHVLGREERQVHDQLARAAHLEVTLRAPVV